MCKPSQGDVDWLSIKVYYCDILHRPEEEFYRASSREIINRIEKYAELKGFKEKAQVVQEYDTEE